jgi:hypothetical protein
MGNIGSHDELTSGRRRQQVKLACGEEGVISHAGKEAVFSDRRYNSQMAIDDPVEITIRQADEAVTAASYLPAQLVKLGFSAVAAGTLANDAGSGTDPHEPSDR